MSTRYLTQISRGTLRSFSNINWIKLTREWIAEWLLSASDPFIKEFGLRNTSTRTENSWIWKKIFEIDGNRDRRNNERNTDKTTQASTSHIRVTTHIRTHSYTRAHTHPYVHTVTRKTVSYRIVWFVSQVFLVSVSSVFEILSLFDKFS